MHAKIGVCTPITPEKFTVQAEDLPKKGPTLPTGITVLEFFHDHLLKIKGDVHQFIIKISNESNETICANERKSIGISNFVDLLEGKCSGKCYCG